MLVGVGCQPNGGEDTTSPAEISVSPAETAISLEGDTKTFTITSNASWVATCEAEGVTCTPEMGKGNGSVTVTVPATTSPRAVVVTFTASKQAVTEGVSFTDSKSVTATIYQNAGGEVVEGGIATIKDAGNHNVEGAWIVAKNAKSIVITDNSGAYIMVFLNKESELSVGQVVNVSGEVELSDKSGLLQFKSTTTVTATGDTIAVSHGTPKDITTYAALDSYANNKTYVYAEMKGQLNVSGTYYNLYVDGKSEHNDYKGSIAYPSSAIASELTALNGANIVVRGYMVGVNGTVYANIVAVEVEVDSSNPVLKADNISGVAAAGVTNATHNIVVAGIENVTATPDGVIVTAAEVNGNVLTYTVAPNEGESREGKITLSAEGVEDVVISVFQRGVIAGGTTVDDVLNLAFTGVSGTTYTDWSGKTGTSGTVYAGQSAGDKNSIQLRSNKSNSGVISTTSVGKARKVVVTWHADTANGRTLDIYGSNTAYTAASDLYGDKKGTKLGSIVKGTSTELEIMGDYAYIGMRSKESAMYLTDITISWEVE